MACGCSGTHRPVLITSALAVADWLILPGRGFTPAHGYASVTSGTDIRGAAGAVLHPTLIALPASASPPRYPTPRQPSAWCSACCTCSRSPQPRLRPDDLRHLQQIGPLSAGLDVKATIAVNSLPLTPGQGLGVIALCTAGTLLLGALALKSRDA
jgi:ABC-2 type transport system permease protein